MRQFLLIFFFFEALFSAAQCDSINVINEKVITLVRAKTGKKVLRGECWDLAKYALDEAGADWDGLYNYGRLLGSDECLMPGDIIQFKNVKVQYKIGKQTFTETMAHHTAIVNKVLSSDEVELIHQNTGQHGRKVGVTKLRFSTVVKGKYMIYRPVTS